MPNGHELNTIGFHFFFFYTFWLDIIYYHRYLVYNFKVNFFIFLTFHRWNSYTQKKLLSVVILTKIYRLGVTWIWLLICVWVDLKMHANTSMNDFEYL